MSQLTYNQLKETITSGDLSKIYFFYGDDCLIKSSEKLLKSKILTNDYSDFDFNLFTEENLTLEKFISSTETFPITTEFKLIIIHNPPFEQWETSEIDIFLNLLKEIPNFIYVIISQSDEVNSSSKFKKIQKFIEKIGTIGKFSSTDISLEKQIILSAKEKYGKNLSLKCAKIITKTCSTQNINSIESELQKICEFEPSDYITENSLKILIKSNLKINIFELPKAIQAKNISKSLNILSKLFDQSEEPVVILAIIASDYIDLLRTKSFTDNGQLISKISEIYNYKNKEFRLKNSLKNCKNISPKQIKNCLKEIIKADYEIKSSNLNPQIILCRLIVRLILNNENSHT